MKENHTISGVTNLYIKKNMDNRKISYGFTLLEILVAIFVFAIIMTALFSSFNAVSTTTEAVDRGISSYETA